MINKISIEIYLDLESYTNKYILTQKYHDIPFGIISIDGQEITTPDDQYVLDLYELERSTYSEGIFTLLSVLVVYQVINLDMKFMYHII